MVVKPLTNRDTIRPMIELGSFVKITRVDGRTHVGRITEIRYAEIVMDVRAGFGERDVHACYGEIASLIRL